MTNHPNRSRSSSYIILLTAVNRLWKNHGAASEAIFSSAENARQTIAGFSGRGALSGAKVMRITTSDEPGAIFHRGWYLIDA